MLVSFLGLLGIAAGALNTIGGLGGGQLMVLVLAAAGDGPRAALALASPALLLGNAHRALLFRRHVDWPLLGAFALGAIPGSVIGGRVAAALPDAVVQVLLVASTALSIARACGVIQLSLPRAAMAPAGLAIGVLSGTSGAGLLLAPLLMAHGLSGPPYIATSALCAVSLHVGRVAGLALGGLLDGATLGRSALLAAAIVAGNLAGERLRRRFGPRASAVLENGVLVACAALALAGLR